MTDETTDRQGCPEWRVMMHGFVDDELDSVHSAQFENHLASCPDCTAELERLQIMRRLTRQDGVKWPMPSAVRSTLLDAIAEDGRSRAAARHGAYARQTWWARALRYLKEWSFIPSLGVLAASAFLFVNAPSSSLPIQNEVLASHIRSLLANHLTDVLTSDQHTVKPWFDGKIDFSPPVVDLAPQGFPLVGGRVDYVGGKVVAALIYKRHAHIINVFVWPDKPQAQAADTHEGYNVVKWSAGGLVFWAVSDVGTSDLDAFRDDFIHQAGL